LQIFAILVTPSQKSTKRINFQNLFYYKGFWIFLTLKKEEFENTV